LDWDFVCSACFPKGNIYIRPWSRRRVYLVSLLPPHSSPCHWRIRKELAYFPSTKKKILLSASNHAFLRRP
jgi:hypothetical protein